MTTRLAPHHGIAIGPILFIVAILAVLATAIAAGGSNFSTSTATEKARTLATAMINDAVLIKQAVARVMALGCSETQINFYDPSVAASSNPSAPADNHCDIFNLKGGGLIYVAPIYDICNGAGDGSTCTRQGTGADAVPGIGTSASELTWVTYYVDRTVCDQINSLLGRTTDSGTSSVTGAKFVGTYASTITFTAYYTGADMACLRQNASMNIFYAVLLPR